jgi:hypothetical protein
MEYNLGNHLLRFCFVRPYMKRTNLIESWLFARFQIYDTFPGDAVNSVSVPDGVYAYVEGRKEIRGGTFDANTSAAYIEDIWGH